MALQTGLMKPEEWECYLIGARSLADSAKIHAATFMNKEELTDAGLIYVKRAESHVNKSLVYP